MKLMISSSPHSFGANTSVGLYTPAAPAPGTIFTMTSIATVAPILRARSVTPSDTENILIKSIA